MSVRRSARPRPRSGAHRADRRPRAAGSPEQVWRLTSWIRQYTLYVGTILGVTVRVGELFREVCARMPRRSCSSTTTRAATPSHRSRTCASAVIGELRRSPGYVSLGERGFVDEPCSW